jgi:hypothetical protein
VTSLAILQRVTTSHIKQAMFQDYKVAYSEEGDRHKEEEAQSTVTVG